MAGFLFCLGAVLKFPSDIGTFEKLKRHLDEKII